MPASATAIRKRPLMRRARHVVRNARDRFLRTETLVLASGQAHAVVNAHTRIAPGADDATVRQRLNGIPLAGEPRLVLRPHLEILHDKVQAAHGATWGALPQEALFYARQRGLPHWGISESGYNAVDTRLNYQYRAFGVPGLGLKRGLADDLVVAPYGFLLLEAR
mgnify:CR=1 FL=1